MFFLQVNPSSYGGFQGAPSQAADPGADDQTAPNQSGCKWKCFCLLLQVFVLLMDRLDTAVHFLLALYI